MIWELIAITALAISIILFISTTYLLRRVNRLYKGLVKLIELKPSKVKRVRKRYIVFAALFEDEISINELDKALRDVFIMYYGVSLYSKASPRIVFYDERLGRGVLRVSHTCVDHAIATLGLIKSINNKRCIIVPIRTTGTLKKAQEYMLKTRI
ncbi:MAG: Rpp14/Pop5 family protein [Desulfurococcaceae archaeon]